ncbi:MAG: cache domain-containing protein [Pirellulaceae bacterium]|jgi:two-component system NtrC family sensor kinase|nr:cache domain-containing protein [Pirellulaceae bacterium]
MSIRFKMTMIAVAVILLANSLLSFLAIRYLGYTWLREVQTRVQRNLGSARAAYDGHIDLISAYLSGAARSPALAEQVEAGDWERLRRLLTDLRQTGDMDFVTLLGPEGDVLCRLEGPPPARENLSEDVLVRKALQTGDVTRGTVVFSHARLQAEGPELAQRACFELVPTPAARPTTDKVRRDGLIVAAVVPVCNNAGRRQALLYGGKLLNRQYEVVDAIKRMVFPQESYRGRDIGTVTIFQGDLRIATNVKMDDGARAVGTRLSDSVCAAVLDRGGTWAAPAFVVNDWYITAYEPLRDPEGRVVGVLYVGLMQAPFTRQLNIITAVFLAIVLGATIASVALLLLANHLVLYPIQRVVGMAQKIIGGDLTARVGIRPPGEFGVLCRAVDSMAQAMVEREELLRLATRQEIGRSEQLASVGRLAAGVAHEINNPLTGVLAFADMMRDKENLDDEDRHDLDLIIRETKRVREIVRGLLDFARETPFVQKPLDINELIGQSLLLLGKREAFEQIYTVQDLSDHLPLVLADRNQMQQVLLNLALNACEAMHEGGTLMVASAAVDDRVVVKVTDTGCGIKREHLDQIFEPFFTTKPVGKGTGLGLSVSYGIVQQHGGTLEVESEVGKGTTFTLTLPAAPSSAAGGAPAAA